METPPDKERAASNGAASGLISQPGHNCWRREQASRASLLIDAENYFDALAESLERAERSVLISCWDFDTRLRLRHGLSGGDFPTLARLLSDAVSRKPELRIYILLWNFPVFFALDRELLPLLNFRLRSRGRIKLHFDSLHPVSASHHQKVVVVDDRVAYVGGIDLTSRRWDTSEHLPRDPRRTESAHAPYRSYHDVQMVVEGDAAASLGELFRDRWLRSAGYAVTPPASSPAGDPWPGKLVPDLSDLPVSIVRTDPMAAGGPVREVEELYLDLISSARRYLYFEAPLENLWVIFDR